MIIDVDLPTAHDDGRFISAKVSRIVELVREYDNRLDVKWVPPDLRGADDPAFAITERLRDGSEVVAFYVQDESEFDERILQRIILGDNAHHSVEARINAENAAAAAVAEKRRRDEVLDYADLARSMIVTGKHTYRHDGKVYRL